MTYLSFLALFLGLPLGALLLAGATAGRRQPLPRLALAAVGAHVLLALVYTTPWDNYLVASGVWTYARARVLGLTLGWVPLEEYGFFVLQTLLTGLCAALLASRWQPPAARRPTTGAPKWLKPAAMLLLGGSWALAVWALAAGWKPAAYLGLELAWALPPIALQVAVGAEALWARRRAVLAVLLPISLYLCAADALAIRAGVWHIDPAQSLNLFVAGLPIEEAVFFMLTNTLVVFGVTLVLAPPEAILRWHTHAPLRVRAAKTLRAAKTWRVWRARG